MRSPEEKIIHYFSDLTCAVGLSLGFMGAIEYYYGDKQKSITINKVAIGMSIASIALSATNMYMYVRSKKH